MNMVKKRVAELEGAHLDWAVVVAAGKTPRMYGTGVQVHNPNHDPDMGEPWVLVRPSTDWGWGGPIIERERMCIEFLQPGRWIAYPRTDGGINARMAGTTWSVYCENLHSATPLIAAMRAFVASKIGNEVEVPAC